MYSVSLLDVAFISGICNHTFIYFKYTILNTFNLFSLLTKQPPMLMPFFSAHSVTDL